MITELLDAAINEVSCNNLFELTEFQLGIEPMIIFIEECKRNMGVPMDAEITKINKYKEIRVREHPSKDAVMYSISLKKKEATYQRQGDVNWG